MNAATRQHWHLDKRVPIVLIATLVAQTLIITWYASRLANQIESNTARVQRLEIMVEQGRSERSDNSTAIAVIAENLRHLTSSMARIEAAVVLPDGRVRKVGPDEC